MAGGLSKYKFEFLPRLTVTTLTHMLEINLGFLWFQLLLTIFSKPMQEINKNSR